MILLVEQGGEAASSRPSRRAKGMAPQKKPRGKKKKKKKKSGPETGVWRPGDRAKSKRLADTLAEGPPRNDAGLALQPRSCLTSGSQSSWARTSQTEHAYQACQRPGRGTLLTSSANQLWQATQRVT